MKRILSTLLICAMVLGCCGCKRSGTNNTRTVRSSATRSGDEKKPGKTRKTEDTDETEDPTFDPSEFTTVDGPDSIQSSESNSGSTDPSTRSDGITTLNMYIGEYGTMLSPYNDVAEIIAKKTGVRVNETYFTGGMSQSEYLEVLIASGELPDLIDARSENHILYEDRLLVPWDDYLDDPKYADLRAYHTDAEWEMLRQSDGHIYWCDCFYKDYQDVSATRLHSGYAFWIQVRVLEWAGYPKIETLDDYFKLLKDYVSTHHVNEDGTEVIPYTMICEDWRYYSIEAAPQMLDGGAYEGYVSVDDSFPKHPVIENYDTSDTAKEYFKTLNKAYSEGLIDQDFASQNYDEYVTKINTGAVLGLCDQYWDFAYSANDAFRAQGFSDLGYDYVPLGLTLEAGTPNHYDCYTVPRDCNCGVAVTTSCKDPDVAFQFMNDLLSEEIHDLRFWGVEGDDYEVGADRLRTRTDTMRMRWLDQDYLAVHACSYYYLPHYEGYHWDGKNTMRPQDSLDEFFSDKSNAFKKCCEAYGCESYRDFLRSEPLGNRPWHPLYIYSNNIEDINALKSFTSVQELKHQWLPQLVISNDFDAMWKKYVTAYDRSGSDAFYNYMQARLDETVR